MPKIRKNPSRRVLSELEIFWSILKECKGAKIDEAKNDTWTCQKRVHLYKLKFAYLYSLLTRVYVRFYRTEIGELSHIKIRWEKPVKEQVTKRIDFRLTKLSCVENLLHRLEKPIIETFLWLKFAIENALKNWSMRFRHSTILSREGHFFRVT